MLFTICPETKKPIFSEKEQNRRVAFVAALRGLADFYESHPVQAPYGLELTHYASSKEELAAMVRGCGSMDKYGYGADDSYLRFKKEFGAGVELRIAADKENTCERVKVGETVIPARPAHYVHAEPEKTVEKFEWVCGSILKDAGVADETAK